MQPRVRSGCFPAGGSQGHRPGPRVPCRRPQSRASRHVAAHPSRAPTHLTAHGRRWPAPWRRRQCRTPKSARPPAAAPSAASSSPPQTPARGGAELLAEGGRRRRLQGLTKPDGAPRRYLYAPHVVMETHQLKPASIGSGREVRGRDGGSVAANRGPGARRREARAGRVSGAEHRACPPTHPSARAPRPASCPTRPAAYQRTRITPRGLSASEPQGPMGTGRESAGACVHTPRSL